MICFLTINIFALFSFAGLGAGTFFEWLCFKLCEDDTANQQKDADEIQR